RRARAAGQRFFSRREAFGGCGQLWICGYLLFPVTSKIGGDSVRHGRTDTLSHGTDSLACCCNRRRACSSKSVTGRTALVARSAASATASQKGIPEEENIDGGQAGVY